VVVPTRERVGERLKGGMLVLGSESKGEVQGKEDTLTEAICKGALREAPVSSQYSKVRVLS